MSTSLWRQVQRQNFRNVSELCDFLQLDALSKEKLLQDPAFSLNLPKRIASKIEKNNINDPLFKQFVALKQEELIDPSFEQDPVNDQAFRKKGRLLHKYQGRALLVTTGACAMHCRYCFRKNFEYGGKDFSFEDELLSIKEDPTITEIILSGGDPLSLSNEMLKKLIGDLEKNSHLKRLRFHTRFPLGIPERIDEEFLEILKNTRFQVWFVIHCNHPNELDDFILEQLKKVQKLGIPVLNQAVLLKGINDNVDCLKTLFETFVDHGILPYYLHQLDPVQGAMHFEVSMQEGLELIDTLKGCLPGYGVPKYVKEIPFAKSKVSLKD
jgi:EF-P beta-lysylation protein EpmB